MDTAIQQVARNTQQQQAGINHEGKDQTWKQEGNLVTTLPETFLPCTKFLRLFFIQALEQLKVSSIPAKDENI